MLTVLSSRTTVWPNVPRYIRDAEHFAGGRQVEGSAPTAWALQQICASPKVKAAQDSGKFTILFDSGIRTGSDIIKAIALGAQGVLRKFTESS